MNREKKKQKNLREKTQDYIEQSQITITIYEHC